MTDYTSKDVIDRQNITPNAGCMIDGVFYDVRNLIHERDQARVEAAAAYERAAIIAFYPEQKLRAKMASNLDIACLEASERIRALATEPGTTALAEMLDAETRACAQIASTGLWASKVDIKKAILARIDQRKETS